MGNYNLEIPFEISSFHLSQSGFSATVLYKHKLTLFPPLVTITEVHALQKQLFGKNLLSCLKAEFTPCGHPASSNNPLQTTVPAKPQTHNPSGDVEYAQQVHWFWSSMHFQHSVKANLPNCMPASRRLGPDILGLAPRASAQSWTESEHRGVEDEPPCSAVLSYES